MATTSKTGCTSCKIGANNTAKIGNPNASIMPIKTATIMPVKTASIMPITKTTVIPVQAPRIMPIVPKTQSSILPVAKVQSYVAANGIGGSSSRAQAAINNVMANISPTLAKSDVLLNAAGKKYGIPTASQIATSQSVVGSNEKFVNAMGSSALRTSRINNRLIGRL